jgi:asparagine synthase (glutamine-hydrolysing)
MIPELADLIKNSTLQTLEDRVSISFSGGVDSALIATIASRHAETELFSAGVVNSPDLEYSERAAEILDLNLERVVLDEEEILAAYGKCYKLVPNSLLKVELLIPIYKAAERAAEKGHETMLFGAGAEELFVGYERYYAYLEEGKDLDKILRNEFDTLQKREIAWIKKVCRKFSIEARFPFYNRSLAGFVFSVPLEKRAENRELKKGILREAATLLRVPSVSVKRKKQAMQYGSKIHNILLRHSGELANLYPYPK